LGSLFEGKPRNGYSPRAVERPTAVKSLTLTATTTGAFRREHFKYIDEEIPPESHLWLAPGDLLIQRANTLEYVGVSAIYDGPPATFIYPDLMMKARANSRILTPFLHCVLSSDPVRTFFRENATGTAGNMPKINQQTVIGAPAVLPPIDEQHEIVRRCDQLMSFASNAEARVAVIAEAVDRLTPSTLAKAFRGALVPQDPNDEPASALLARIRNGKEVPREAPPASGGKPTRRPRSKNRGEIGGRP
jgi:type I restriction enzyme S subunit